MHVFTWTIVGSLWLTAFAAQAELHQGLKLTVDGVLRSYDLYVPDKVASSGRPLVLLYHGHFGSSEVMTGANGKKAPYKRWLTLAEQDNFLVAVPNGEKGSDDKRGWNDCRADNTTNPHTDDVKFTLELIETINRQYPLDRLRIYATGTSNGGNMAIRLALEAPERFAAVAAVVASNPVQSECKEKRLPISVLFMNGTEDPLLPYAGGQVGKVEHGRGTALSTPASVDYWVTVNATDASPTIYKYEDTDPRDKSTVIRHHFPQGKGNTEVVLYEVRGGGHTEPSRREHYRWLYKRIVGNQNYDIEMADEVWQFFRGKRRQRIVE